MHTRDLSCGNGRLALRVIEICRNRDDGFGDRCAQEPLGILLERLKNQRRQIFRAESARTELELMVRAHVTLEACRGQVRMRDEALSGRRANEQGPGVVEAHHGWGEHCSERIRNEPWFAIDDDADEAVGRTEIDPYEHLYCSSC